MASYVGHLTCSSILGAAFGCLGSWYLGIVDWGTIFLGAGLTAIGGLLPDLDSDSGVPVRELFNLVAATVPLLLCKRLVDHGYDPAQTVVIMAATYLGIRYGLSAAFKHLTVHRGMFHSIPAMAICGLGAFLLYHDPHIGYRLFAAGGVMLGFLSHLVLDELYSVDFMGVRIKLNKYAGSALKLYSSSWGATLICYALLGALAWRAWTELS
jgi:hypothetical protein